MNKHLEKSILHWERVVLNPDEPVGRDNCPLCEEYNCFDDSLENCMKCPVQLKTKEQYCDGTPWVEYDISHFNEESRQTLAQAELDFLISLK